MEIWKDVKGYEGVYQVSDLGRVKSLARFRSPRENILKPTPNNKGYLTIGLQKDKKKKTHNIHQVVAIAFLNHIPDGRDIVVDHIDNNKLNNTVKNLQITTHRHNISKDRKNKTSKYSGVCWDKRDKKWRATIRVSGVFKSLGYFQNEDDAGERYQLELSKLTNKQTKYEQI
mgnify:FL=1|tara:strand:- start:1089 stop:1604 length:516 start_codon:yes stop_codon:yes gene_type:complete